MHVATSVSWRFFLSAGGDYEATKRRADRERRPGERVHESVGFRPGSARRFGQKFLKVGPWAKRGEIFVVCKAGESLRLAVGGPRQQPHCLGRVCLGRGPAVRF